MSSSSFWWILFFTFLFGALHSTLAAERVKALFRTCVGETRFRAYRLFYNFVAIGTTLALAVPVLFMPDAPLYLIPEPWVYLTVILQGVLLLCLLLAFRQSAPWEFLGLSQLRGRPENEPPAALMTGGFYSWCRHPLYFFGLAFMWLFPLMSWNLLALFFGLTGYTLLGSLLEEQRLIHEYGDAYREYVRSVPWLIPNPFKRRAR